MSTVTYEVRDRVAEILLDSPPVNALNEGMIDALLQACAAPRRTTTCARSSSAARCRAASAPGCSSTRCTARRRRAPMRWSTASYNGLCEAQFHLGKPSIAAVGGTARGGGMTLAIHCDLIVAAESATFGYPEIDVGLTPAIHYTHLPRIVGRHRAFDLLFTGRTFGATEAMSLGLVSRVVPDADVMEQRARWRARCAPSRRW